MFAILKIESREKGKEDIKRKSLGRHVIVCRVTGIGSSVSLPVLPTDRKRLGHLKNIWKMSSLLLQIYVISSMPLADLFEDNKVQQKRDVKLSVRRVLLDLTFGIYKTLAKCTSLNFVSINKTSEICKYFVIYLGAF